jgi:hypothetical protein
MEVELRLQTNSCKGSDGVSDEQSKLTRRSDDGWCEPKKWQCTPTFTLLVGGNQLFHF